MDIPERLDFSECALFFNGKLLGMSVGAGEVEFGGKLERYADCRSPGDDEWALISSATGTCRVTFADPSAVLEALESGAALALP